MGPTPIAPTPEDELRRAMAARGLMAPQAGAQPASQPAIGATAAAPAVPARGLTPPAAAPQDPALQANVSRLNTLQSSPSGIGGIHNPVLRTGLQVGDALLSSFLPGLAQGIPGTQLHHNELVREARGNVAQGENQANEESKRGLQAAQTAEQASLPELHDTQAQNAALKNQNANQLAVSKQAETASHHQQQLDSTLREHGFKRDETGGIIPLPYGEMSEPQQAVHDLKASQQELADARSALVKAQKDGIPAAAQLAQKRIENAQMNAVTAAKRLGLQEKEYEANYHGTEGGVALPGAPADAAGNPVGPRIANATKQTGQIASRANQAAVIKESGDNLIKEIDSKAGKVGNLGSYWKQYINGTPISDPQVSGLMTSLASFAALQPALHGFRGAQALKEFEKSIGGIPKDPEALKASIRSIQGTAGIVEKHGAPQTVKPPAPSGGPTAAPADPRVKAYADQYFGGDVGKAQAAIDQQRKGK